MNGAAEEKSPGMSSESGGIRSAGQTRISVPARVSRRPSERSRRSVWSREGVCSTTVVGPSSASSPASRTADFSCALATGSS